jgi:hypothetical protein
VRNLILQHWTGAIDALGEASSANIRAYADRIGAEYRLLRGDVFRPGLTAPMQKLQMLSAEFDGYDMVVMLDLDMFAVSGIAENIFTDVEGTGLFSEYTQKVFERCRREHPTLCDKRYAYWGGAIYRLPLELRQRLRRHIKDEDLQQFNRSFQDEGVMHRLATFEKIEQDKIPDRWCHCSYRPDPEKAAMIHVRTKIAPNGPKRTKIENYRALRGVIE